MKYADLVARLADAKDSKQIAAIVAFLKDANNRKHPDINKLKKEWDPDGHDVMDTSKRPDKLLTQPAPEKFKAVPGGPPKPGDVPTPPTGYQQYGASSGVMVPTGEEKVNRVAIPFQQEIVEARVDFAFGIPVKLECNTKDDAEKNVLDIITKIRKSVKIERIDRETAREAHRATRVAVLWTVTQESEKHSRYGKETTAKFRCIVLKPWDGNELYPTFDDDADMIAFSRGYTIKDEQSRDEEWFECYTIDKKYVWRFGYTGRRKDWTLVEELDNPYKKIPVVYMEFEQTPWHRVRTSIARLEAMISDLGDTNMYHASPKIFVQGKIMSFMKKGEAGGILQGDQNAKAEYLSYDRAPESLKLEAEFHYRTIYGGTRTPDMTFEQMSKMTNPSGETMKMLFMAAHLQVLADGEKYNDFQDRQINLLKVMVAHFFKDLKDAAGKIEIEPKITPFVIEEESALIDRLLKANGNQPLISQETSMNMYGKIANVQEELDRMKGETEASDAREIAKEKQLQTAPQDFL